MKKCFLCLTLALCMSTSVALATEIKFQHLWPETHELQYLFTDAIKEAQQLSNNELVIDYYTFGSQTTPLKVNEGLKDGVIDMAVMVPSTSLMSLPYTSSLGMPFLIRDNSTASKGLADIYAASDEMQKEMAKDYHILSVWASGRSVIASKEKVIKSPEDMQGLRTIVSGPMLAQDITTWGGTPVIVEYTDEYTSMKSDAVDAYYNTLFHAVGHDIQDFGKEVTVLTPNVTPFMIAVRNDTWDKLSKIEKDALTKVFNKDFAEKVGTEWYKMGDSQIEKIKADGGKVYELTDQEFKAFADKTSATAHAFWGNILAKAKVDNPEAWIKKLYSLAP